MFIERPGYIERTQRVVDAYYRKHGPCCAGCDHWGWLNSMAGECTRSAPVSGEERMAMLGMKNLSQPAEPGHIVTKRDHVCGEFIDTHDWEANTAGRKGS